jgi:hypothetical protein
MSTPAPAENPVETPVPAAPPAPATPPPAAAPEILIKPAPQPIPLAPVGDYDKSILSQLGLPFYYRHTPSTALARAAYWLASLGLIALIFFNLLYMPYRQDTLMWSIRTTLFGHGGAYPSIDEGARSMFNQFFIFAIIFSGIISPLFATFSFTSERVLGTMEFLRLSPMSTLSIIMGKMFASAYVLHIISGVLLLLGLAAGFCAGLPAQKMFIAIAVIVLSSAVFHAVGAFLAAFTNGFRGFAAVLALIGMGFFMSMLPVAALSETGMSFMGYLSPWGAMDDLFWRELVRWRRSNNPAMFLGTEASVPLYAMGAFIIAFALFVWAACRKLDQPERPALPVVAWIALWCFVLFTALGLIPNYDYITMPGWGAWGARLPYQMAMLVMLFGGGGACILQILDHPHHRETALSKECESVAGREPPVSELRRLWHALFSAGMVLLTASVIVLLAWQLYSVSPGMGRTPFDWNIAILLTVGATILALLFCLTFEAAALSFNSFWVGMAVSGVVISVLIAAMIVPVVHIENCHRYMRRATYAALNYYQFKAGTLQSRQNWDPSHEYQWMQRSPDYAQYIAGLDSLAAATAQSQRYISEPIRFFWDYHTQAFLTYPVVWVVLVVLLLAWRRRAHVVLRREAMKAVGNVSAAGPPAMAAAT